MKAKFKFKPGDKVMVEGMWQGDVRIAGVDAEGIVYEVLNDFTRAMVREADLKIANGFQPEDEKE